MLTTNAIDSLIREVGPVVWEIKIMSTTAGDTPLDVPTSVTKRHRVYGTFRLANIALLEKIGTSKQGDALFVSRETVNIESQIEYDGNLYEITDRIDAKPLHAGAIYTYVLHRQGKRREST